MSKVIISFVCLQIFIQIALTQAINIPANPSFNGMNSNSFPFSNSFPSNLDCNNGYGGKGNGEVGVAGQLTVNGDTKVTGQVPVLGDVKFEGSLPASGTVVISGQCSCGNCGV